MTGWSTHHPTARWKRTRLAVLHRDGYECQLRLAGCTGRATTADHIVPLALGGAMYDPANLRAACGHCNSTSGGGLGSARGRVGRPSRRWLL